MILWKITLFHGQIRFPEGNSPFFTCETPHKAATFDLRAPTRSGHFLGFFSEPSSDLEVGFKGLYIALRLGKTCTLWLFKLHSHGKIHHF